MRKLIGVGLLFALASGAWSMPLGTSMRAVIPAEVQQIICVDYRALHNSETAMALRDRVLPDNLKQFETSLKAMGIVPDRDLDQLTFISFRAPKQSLRVVGVAQGVFPVKAFLRKMAVQKIRPQKLRDSLIYPMGGMQMSFLDDNTILFGELTAVRAALDTRDGQTQSLDSNPQVADLIGSVDSSAVWSVLDQQGTQNMMRSALGEASALTDYDVVKKRLLGSRYGMDFGSGVNFNLDVITSDSITAATLSSLMKAGMAYKRMTASPIEKLALENVTVDSGGSNLKLQFKTDDKKFQSLLHSDLFAAVAR